MADLKLTVDTSDVVKGVQAATRFENQIKKIRTAFNEGRITSAQYQKALNQISSSMTKVGGTYQRNLKSVSQFNAGLVQQQQRLEAVSNAQMQMRSTNVGNTRSMNNFGVAMQQSGYQIGDFLVQVQSGTNYMVAFGQQATQLVGILPMFADNIKFLSTNALIGLSAGLGIVIPLLTALGGAYMRTRDDAEEATDAIGDFTSELDQYVQISERSRKTTTDLQEEFGVMAEKVRDLSGLLKEAAVVRAMDSLTTSTAIFSEDLSDAASQARQLAEQIEIYGDLSPGDDQYARIKQFVDGANEAAEALKLTKNQTIALDNALSSVLESKNMVGVRDNAYDALNQIKGMTFEAGKLPPEVARVVEELEKVLGAASRATSETDNMRAGFDSAASSAAKISAELGVSLSRARELGRIFTGEDAVMSQTVVEGPATDRFDVDTLLGMGYTKEYLESIGKIGGSSSSGGTSGGQLSSQEDYLSRLMQEAQLKLRLIGLSEEEASKFKIIQELREKGLEIDNSRIEAILEVEAAIRKAAEAEKERERIMDTVSDTIESAMMGLVDGSKSVEDAFKNMLRNILLEIYKQQVAKPATEGIGGFVGDALGGLFGGGSGVNYGANSPITIAGRFADGGIVNSPTMFPMANGAGLMGEAGPEAIMPLKRNSQGKLGVETSGGNQGNVTVNNHFHIAANGDDSVKRIIAQEAPRIANLTQKQIMDQRRRGGAMKSTFG